MSDVQTVNPATGEALETFSFTSDADLNRRLEAAAAAQRAWRERSFDERAAVLRGVAATLRSRKAALARTATLEMGKPLVQAGAEVEKCAWTCDHFADHAAGYLADLNVPSNATQSYVAFRPLGIVLAVMPWNFPYWQVFRAAAPALMAGNGMVLKHASNVTRCALEIEKIFRDGGAPDGLFSTFVLPSSRIAALIADPRMAAVTLTGSEGAGESVAAAAGHALKKTVLELGGSDPFIVLADADLESAAKTAVKARFQNNGQSCIAAKRFIVEAPVHDEFVERFSALASAQRVGDPLDETTEIGPVARDDLRATLRKQVDESVCAGARVACGGSAIDRPGFFFEPTVLAGVQPSMPVFREETFGPVAAVSQAHDADHAVELANDSSFGLGGNLWSQDLERAQRMAARMETGNVFINGMTASDPRLPFGGVKRSGYGRELSPFGIREFVNVQTVWIGPQRQGATQKPGAE